MNETMIVGSKTRTIKPAKPDLNALAFSMVTESPVLVVLILPE